MAGSLRKRFGECCGSIVLDKQSQSSRRECRCRKLQDQPFAFCGATCILQTGFSTCTWSVSSCVRMKISTKKAEILRLPRKPSQCTLQASVINCSRLRSSRTLGLYSRVAEGGTRRLVHGLLKQMQFWVTFITLWSQNVIRETPQSFQFSNQPLLWSSPIATRLVSLLKECYLKYKRQRWDFCEDFAAWH